MLTKSRTTLAVALATAALGASPALATAADTAPLDARGEHAASLSVTPPGSDLRSPDAREPVGGETSAPPVVVELSDPAVAGFDWTAAIIGMGAGLALAVLAGVGVSGGRRRHAGPSTV
jgi:hypothetical protein